MVFFYQDGAINLEISPRIADVNGNDLFPMLMRLNKFSSNQTAIKWNADVGGTAATGETTNATATTDSTSGAVIPCSLPIGVSRFRHTFSVKTTQMAEAAANGEGVLANLLAFAARNGMRRIMRSTATELYAGAGVAADAGMVGLSQLHANVTSGLSTDDYAGGDVSTYPTWSNYVNTDAVARELTTALMFDMSEEIISGSTLGVNSNFTAIYTTPALATKYKSLFQAVSDFNSIPAGLADVGYTGLSFEGRPIFIDPYCTAGTMYFVDEDELGLYTFTENQFAYGDEMPVDGLNFKIVELARTNPDVVQFAIVCKPQLKVSRRAAVAVLENVE